MKKIGILNHRISEVIAMMGHGDSLVIADAGLPIPDGVERIDLAVVPAVPPVPTVVSAVSLELEVESLVLAEELLEMNNDLVKRIRGTFQDAESLVVPHEEFKERCRSARAVIRTGDVTPYANVILISRVTF